MGLNHVTLSETETRADALLSAAIDELRSRGFPTEEIAHSLVSAGLAQLAGNLNSVQLVEHLTMIRDFVSERIEDTRKEMN